MELKATPLVEEHKKLGAKLAPFGGWLMPIEYSDIISEHKWTRSSCSLFDICHMGEFFIYGDPKENNLDKILTIDLNRMQNGSCRYGFMLDENGGILDDVITYRIKDDEWMLVVNAATAQADQLHIERHISKDCKFQNLSDKLGKLDLQGPLSRDVLISLFGDGINQLDYYRFGYFSMLGEENIISRTGYTGELGYELYISTEKIGELWNLLLNNDKVKPAGLGARDTLRLEMCYPLYGQDISRHIFPTQTDFDRAVDFNKDFIGKSALKQQTRSNSIKKLSYFLADSRRAPRHGYKIYDEDKEIGFITSGSFSPSLLCGIGIGYIDASHKRTGESVLIKDGKVEIKATIADKPFYKKGSIRS
ncbi:glycine cleavage system aminomethyltransferase GcvT [Thermoproteota archaeon]